MSTTPRDSALTEWLLRAFGLLAYGTMVWIVARHWWADTSRHTLLLLLVSEGLTLALILFAKRAHDRDLSPAAIASTVSAMTFFLFFDYSGTLRLIPEWAGVALQCAGMAWQITAKMTLGRSFGLLPAVRGLVTGGPYQVVRHPIYLGYLIGHVGFLLSNFSLQSLLVLAILYTAQTVRMLREESMLKGSEQQGAYHAYCDAVRYRIVPFVF
jgi:protein-S-isoprenylcysteine O-methyltransferase Ste14